MHATIRRATTWAICLGAAVLWACVVPPRHAAADYYIEAANGSDAADGTSEGTAWKTLARIARAELKPGDRVLLKRGETWAEPLPVPASGAPGKPIVYTAYGEGARPKIVAQTYAVEIARKSGITLEELDITGDVYTIFIHAREGQYSDFVFLNCTITSRGGAGHSGHCIHQASEPIITVKDGKPVADEGPATFSRFVVSGCTLTPGRQGWSNGINLHNNVMDLVIENNVIGPAGEDAILLWNCARGRVTGNTLGGNGENSIDIKNSSDITVSHNTCANDTYGAILLHEIMFLEGHKPNDLNHRIVIEHNTITGAGQWFKAAPSAPEITAGIWLNMSDDCTVRYNRLTDCLGDGISIDDAESSQNNNQVYGNVIIGDGQQDWNGGIALGDCVGTKVFNNLVYNQRAGAGICLRGGGNTQGIQLLNNIVTASETTPATATRPPVLIDLRAPAAKDLVCDCNCFWPNRADAFQGSTPDRGSLAHGDLLAWQQALQLDAHSLAADPNLKDPDNGDFTLAPDSPCIGKARKIDGYACDAAGTAIPLAGPTPDIGPFQTVVEGRLVTLSSRPEVGLEIYIDGVTKGLRTPQTLTLPVGNHTVRLVVPRFKTEPVWSTEYADGTANDYVLKQYGQTQLSESVETGCTVVYNATDVVLFGRYSLKTTSTPGLMMRGHPNLAWHWSSSEPGKPWIANPLEIRESLVNVWTYVSGTPGPEPNWFSLITVVFDAGWDSGRQVTTTDILTRDMKIYEWFWLDSGKGNRFPVADAPRYPLNKWVKVSLYTKLDGAQSHVMVFQDDYLAVDAPNVDFDAANKRPDYMHWGGYGSEGNGPLTVWNSRTSVERVIGPGPTFSFARWDQDGNPIAGDLAGVQINLTADTHLCARGDAPSDLPGDLNNDCKVNILDLIWVRSRLGQDAGIGDNWRADANEDGKINILDLIFVRNRLGAICP